MKELEGCDWRWVVGCEDKYAVTSAGEIYSVPRTMWNGKVISGGFIKPLNGTVYYHVNLTFNGGHKKTKTIHTIVCEAFHGPKPSPDHEVAHSDGTKKNNNKDNLRWVTKKENMDDQRMHGVLRIGESNGMAKLTEAVILKIRKFHADCKSFNGACKKFSHIPPDTIKDIIYRKTWKHI